MMSKLRQNWALIAMCFFTMCGVILYGLGLHKIIELTPLYILGLLTLSYASTANKSQLVEAWLWAGIIGFAAEIIGVNTGLLFGSYSYGSVLGVGIFGVPFLVTALWALVMTSLWSITGGMKSTKRIAVVVAMAVAYDSVLEHFAVRFGLWAWAGSIPLTNALGWAVVSVIVGVVFVRRKVELRKNNFLTMVLPAQIIFFVSLILLQ
jgi:bisanhydrobacterioruberin hydratase